MTDYAKLRAQEAERDLTRAAERQDRKDANRARRAAQEKRQEQRREWARTKARRSGRPRKAAPVTITRADGTTEALEQSYADARAVIARGERGGQPTR